MYLITPLYSVALGGYYRAFPTLHVEMQPAFVSVVPSSISSLTPPSQLYKSEDQCGGVFCDAVRMFKNDAYSILAEFVGAASDEQAFGLLKEKIIKPAMEYTCKCAMPMMDAWMDCRSTWVKPEPRDPTSDLWFIYCKPGLPYQYVFPCSNTDCFQDWICSSIRPSPDLRSFRKSSSNFLTPFESLKLLVDWDEITSRLRYRKQLYSGSCVNFTGCWCWLPRGNHLQSILGWVHLREDQLGQRK